MPEDWTERSNREAAAMLADERGLLHTGSAYNAIVELLAVAYRKGALDGMNRAMEILREQVSS